MSKAAFEKIAEGLQEALAVAKGESIEERDFYLEARRTIFTRRPSPNNIKHR